MGSGFVPMPTLHVDGVDINGIKLLRLVLGYPLPRRPRSIDNYNLFQAIIYRDKTGCSWRNIPPCFGDWRTIYRRYNRWRRKGLLPTTATRKRAERNDAQARRSHEVI